MPDTTNVAGDSEGDAIQVTGKVDGDVTISGKGSVQAGEIGGTIRLGGSTDDQE